MPLCSSPTFRWPVKYAEQSQDAEDAPQEWKAAQTSPASSLLLTASPSTSPPLQPSKRRTSRMGLNIWKETRICRAPAALGDTRLLSEITGDPFAPLKNTAGHHAAPASLTWAGRAAKKSPWGQETEQFESHFQNRMKIISKKSGNLHVLKTFQRKKSYEK